MSTDLTSTGTAIAQPQPAAQRPKVPWNPLWALTFAVVIFFASQIIAGLVVSIYPAFQHWSHARANDWLDNSVLAQFFFVLLAEGLVLETIYLWLHGFRTKFSAIGWVRPRLRDAAIGLAGWGIYFVVFLLLVSQVQHYFPHFNINQEQQIGFNHVHGTTGLVLTFVSLVVLPPLAEELLMRGFLYTSFRKRLNFLWATLLTSAIFASAHLPEGGAAGPLWIGAIDTFLLSLVLCYMREKTGSLWPGITAHAIKNGIAFMALFVVGVH
ncbi:MAG TPA: type II CAAX endopeptidase family protein [Candidatus Saccharimonadales bacterium]|nr:type II CAAX endopeptidase family protein [Candidatus Saccharimonadales bacterium]